MVTLPLYSKCSKKESGAEQVKAMSPCSLTSLFVQHDESPDAGIFTLTDRQKERWKEDSGEEKWGGKGRNKGDRWVKVSTAEHSRAIRAAAEVGRIAIWNQIFETDPVWQSGKQEEQFLCFYALMSVCWT